MILLVALVLSAPPALAREDAAGQELRLQPASCLASGPDDRLPTASVIAALDWDCSAAEPSLKPQRTWLRFPVIDGKQPPRYLVTYRSPLVQVHVLALEADGSVRRLTRSNGALESAGTGGYVRMPLPEIDPGTRAIVVAIDRATHIMTLQSAQLANQDPGEAESAHHLQLALAALCGMMLLPMIFNVAFWRILREPFVLWHCLLALALLGTILVNSGLSQHMVDLTVPQLSRVTTIMFGFSVAAGGMFARSFIEADRLHPALRAALPVAALWAVGLAFFHANFPFVGRPWQTDLYYLVLAPILFLYIAVLGDALWRGSRAAKFQLVGWLPLLTLAATRMLGQLTPLLQPTDAMPLFYVGCVLEIIATTLGVTDRFMAIRQQRDHARTAAQLLEQLTERDTLTGLHNRRMLEERFETLRYQGFTVLAVLDLDHFKAINDSFGHGTGDDVLRAVAEALQPDEDTLAVRMGGEEFVLLLRGRYATERAEHRRRAITRIVAEKIRLDRPVTASMGLVDAPFDALPKADFDTLYRRADGLLYEAKSTGRNRMMCEKLQVFHAGKRDRRQHIERRVA